MLYSASPSNKYKSLQLKSCVLKCPGFSNRDLREALLGLTYCFAQADTSVLQKALCK